MASTAQVDRPRSLADRLALKPRYSYRDDRSVPPFDDGKPLIVLDGVCVLCSRVMREIAGRDRAGRFRFTAAQGELGDALMRHYGVDPENPETVLLIEDGRALGKIDMALRVADVIGGPFALLKLLSVLPRPVQDWCYDRVAKNRYRLFGRTDACIRPDPTWADRVIP